MTRPPLILLALCLPTSLAAQVSAGTTRSDSIGTPNYDVVLEVPELSVDSIHLQVAGLSAHLALDARVADLVMITAGADVVIDQVDLRIEGVVAEAYAYIDLDNVARIVDRALTTLEQNPEIVNSLTLTVDSVVGAVGGVARSALGEGGAVDRAVGAVGRTVENLAAEGGLLETTLDVAGRTVNRVVDTSGNLLEQTLGTAGEVVSSRSLGSVLDLPVVEETTDAAGRTVRRVRDTSGRLIEFVLGSGGAVSNARVLGGGR